ncbi:MAG: F0F1 ATP synthase subunit delta [Candidatus Dasytiphilus stammeri]
MSELITLARPYARATFDLAVAQNKIEQWQTMLAICAEVSSNEQLKSLISDALGPKILSKLFIDICSCSNKLDICCKNLIKVMAHNYRLKLFPEVLKQFIKLRTIYYDMRYNIEITSVNPLTEKQYSQIKIAMEKSLSSKVNLNCKIDKTILAGIIIRIDDTVIDGSIRNRLNNLARVLQY